MTAPTANARTVARALEEEARSLLALLDEGQKEAVFFPLDDTATRTDWGYFPRRFHGLSLAALDHWQQKHVHRLLAAALSLHTYATVTSIIALDNVLDLLEGYSRPEVRDPARYYLSIFGTPGDKAWAFQFEGHHVSVNFSIVNGEVVSATPFFLGSNPAELHHNGRRAWRLLSEEEDAARELLTLFDRDQLQRVVISDVAPPDFVLMNAPTVPQTMLPGEIRGVPSTNEAFDRMTPEQKERLRFTLDAPAGFAAASMNRAQQERLAALLAVYLERLPGELAVLERARIGTRLGEIHFAWAGSTAASGPHYYRVQGPGLLVEFDNTQDNANHRHACWRNPANDFGGDLLRQHLSGAH